MAFPSIVALWPISSLLLDRLNLIPPFLSIWCLLIQFSIGVLCISPIIKPHFQSTCVFQIRVCLCWLSHVWWSGGEISWCLPCYDDGKAPILLVPMLISLRHRVSQLFLGFN